jgi:hypothetical protein
MYVTGKTDNRTFGYEIYFTSPMLKKQFVISNIEYDYVMVDKFQRSIEALYTLINCEIISEDMANKIKSDLSHKINEHIREFN